MQAYLDIGTFSTRSLVVDEVDEEGFFVEPSVLDRKCAGRGREGFVNMDQAKIDLLSLGNSVANDLGQSALPQYSVLVRDNDVVSGTRQFSTEMRGSTVRKSDVMYLRRNINLHISDTHYPIHRIPIGYRINDGELIEDPVGLAADKLTFFVFIVAVNAKELRNYQRLLKHANMRLRRFVYDVIAHGVAALHETQNRTAMVIEFGAMNTGVSLWQAGKPVFMHSVSMGMDNLTVELVRRLRCSTVEAERLKKQRGFDRVSKPLTYKLSDNQSQGSIASAQFFQVVQAELARILNAVQFAISESEWPEPVPSYRHKVILTGGARNMAGLQKQVQDILKVEVLVARGHQMTDGETAFMGCLGQYYLDQDDLGQTELLTDARISSPGKGIWSAIKNIFS